MVWLPIVLAAFFLVSCGGSGSSSGGVIAHLKASFSEQLPV
jgi:hypothetical protein